MSEADESTNKMNYHRDFEFEIWNDLKSLPNFQSQRTGPRWFPKSGNLEMMIINILQLLDTLLVIISFNNLIKLK